MQMPSDIMAHWRPSPLLRSSFLQLHRLGGVRMARYTETLPYEATLVPLKQPHSSTRQRSIGAGDIP